MLNFTTGIKDNNAHKKRSKVFFQKQGHNGYRIRGYSAMEKFYFQFSLLIWTLFIGQFTYLL